MGIDVGLAAGIATVTISNRGKRNALSWDMMGRLTSVLTELDEDPAVRVVVITGADGDFCVGAELGEPRLEPLPQMERINRTPLAVYAMRAPTIAKVRGFAVGAGMNLALACDLIVASADAKFSEIFVRRALTPDFGGSWMLPRLIGLHRAKELCMLGDILTADQVAALGLLNRVVPVDDLDKTTDELAARLAALPAMTLTLTKRLLDGSSTIGFADALRREAEAQAVCLNGGDFKEALAAFQEKREPAFAGATIGPR